MRAAPVLSAPGPFRRAETWLWLGPLGHLAGGALDIGETLARHLLLPRLQLGRRPLATAPRRR